MPFVSGKIVADESRWTVENGLLDDARYRCWIGPEVHARPSARSEQLRHFAGRTTSLPTDFSAARTFGGVFNYLELDNRSPGFDGCFESHRLSTNCDAAEQITGRLKIKSIFELMSLSEYNHLCPKGYKETEVRWFDPQEGIDWLSASSRHSTRFVVCDQTRASYCRPVEVSGPF